MDATRKQIQNGRWTTGLCGCLEDPTSCIEAHLCPCCQIVDQSQMLIEGKRGKDAASCCQIATHIFCCCAMEWLCASARNRTDIRNRFGIKGCVGTDCCITCCCLCCALSQQYRELSYRGLWPGGLCVSPPVNAPLPPPLMGLSTQAVVYGNAQVYPEFQAIAHEEPVVEGNVVALPRLTNPLAEHTAPVNHEPSSEIEAIPSYAERAGEYS